MKSFILYSRNYCHLCDDMRSALDTLGADVNFSLKVVDIDADPELVKVYDELVPALVEQTIAGNILPICHHFLDRHALQRALAL